MLASYDAAKKVRGPKRHILVDSMGLMLALRVTAGNWMMRGRIPEALQQLGDEDFSRVRLV